MPSDRPPPPTRSLSPRQTFLFAALLLAVTSIGSLLLSSHKLFWEDELFEFYSDARPTLAAVLQGQRETPFSLEPPAFHLLLHGMQHLPFRPEIATRLPSLAALLLTQLCLFALTLRVTRRYDLGLLALALPFTLTTFLYSAEARVYEVLVATYAFDFVLYSQALTRAGRSRAIPVFGLALTLAAGSLLHYYGILLTLPFLAAESARCYHRRRGDWPLTLALLTSLLIVVLNLPFLAGLRPVQAMYFDSGEARWNMVPFTFLWIVDPTRTGALRARGGLATHAAALAILCALAGATWLLWRSARRHQLAAANPFLLTALTAGILLPVVNIAVGIYKAHAYSPRYSLPVIVPLIVLICLLLQPRLRQTQVLTSLLLVLAIGAYRNLHLIRQAQANGTALRSTLLLDPTLHAALSSVPDQKIYIQDLPAFLPAFFYAPPDLKSRLVNVESVDREWFWLHSGPASLFSRYMQQSTSLPITTYEQLREVRGPHLLVLYGASSEWILRELQATGGRAIPLGKALGGDLFKIDCTAPSLSQNAPPRERLQASRRLLF